MAEVNGTTTRDHSPDLLDGTLHGMPRVAARGLALVLLRAVLSFRVVNAENVSPEGPLLVVSNHLSNADPLLLEAAMPRPLFFMGKSELFANPLFRWILLRFGGFPVERGTADRAAIRHAQAVLSQGIAVGIYPEGGRSRTGALVPGLPGVGLIALHTHSPVVPVAITGTEYFPVNGEMPPRRPRATPRGVTVRFGPPFQIPTQVDGLRVTTEEATRLIMVHIAALLPEQYQGVYRDDVQGMISAS